MEEKIIALDILHKNFSPREGEYIVAGFLKKIDGWENVEVTKASRDEGIDIYGEEILSAANSSKARVACQVKWFSTDNYVTGPSVQNFIGSINPRATKGLMVTTSSFTKDAIKYANETFYRGSPIVCVSGKELVQGINEYLTRSV